MESLDTWDLYCIYFIELRLYQRPREISVKEDGSQSFLFESESSRLEIVLSMEPVLGKRLQYSWKLVIKDEKYSRIKEEEGSLEDKFSAMLLVRNLVKNYFPHV